MPKVNDHNLARPRTIVCSDGQGAGRLVPIGSHTNVNLAAATVTTATPPSPDAIAFLVSVTSATWMTLDGTTDPSSLNSIGLLLSVGLQPITFYLRLGSNPRFISDPGSVLNIIWLTGV